MWRDQSIRSLADVEYGKSPNAVRDPNGLIPIIGTSGVQGTARKALFDDEAIVVGRKGTLDNPVYIDGPFWVIDTAYAVLPKSGVNAKWLYYHLDQFDLSKLNEATGVPSISREYLYRVEFPTPGEPVQTEIAEILTCVDTAIEKTDALIEKYEQIKRGMMQDLFTRGLDEAGRLRPPPDDAPHLYHETELGLLPKAWNPLRIEDISKFVTSGSRDWSRFYSEDGDVFIRIGNLTRRHINMRLDNVQHVRLSNRSEGTRTKLQKDDLLVSITADLGIIAVIPEIDFDAYINQHIALIRVDPAKARPRFLGHFLASRLGQLQFERLNDPGAKAGLNLPSIRALRCMLPHEPEQKKIEFALDQVDRYIHQLEIAERKLRNQKAGLMQDLLTGRVRVKSDKSDSEKTEAAA